MVVPPAGDLSPRPASAGGADHLLGALSPRADLVSGGGIDVLLSARRVGPSGKAHGLGMTDEMLSQAISNAARAGATNVEFLEGNIESIPLPGNTIDVVVSNCVITLSVDKPAVFADTFCVLRLTDAVSSGRCPSPAVFAVLIGARLV
ncbi:methyltransferase domain-containing protein [Lentzea albida]|uniref:Arsenite methyltransferase n=1 Tax=Lentzea albida TaxID=65499 RepID=A0A1H9WRF4_9PSEU|nr:Methyltransferase domain-containing protein [Lentzea albida]